MKSIIETDTEPNIFNFLSEKKELTVTQFNKVENLIKFLEQSIADPELIDALQLMKENCLADQMQKSLEELRNSTLIEN